MDAARQDVLRREILAMYEEYVRAFVSDDLATINRLTQFPVAFIAEGQVALADEYPVKPAELRARTGWHDTVDIDVEVVGVTETKAHLLLRHCTRVRADGRPVEHVGAFYALTKAANGWKIFAVSTIQTAAS